MVTQNNSRAADFGATLSEGSTGFAVRKRTGVGMFFHLFLLSSMVLMGAALLVYYRSLEGCILSVAIGLGFALVAQNLERQKKAKNSVEFMNALFSSALGHGYAFCFIVKDTGDVVFYNRPFQAVFPAYIAQDVRTLASLMKIYQFSDEQRETVKKLMDGKTEGSFTIPVRASAEHEPRSYTFEISPIERPTGFFLVRGKL